MSGRGLLRTLAFALGYVGMALISHLTAFSSHHAMLVWLAPGWGVLWLLSVNGRRQLVDLVLFAVATYVVGVLTGWSSPKAIVWTVAALSEVVLATQLLRRVCANLWGCGGDRGLSDTRTLARLLFVLAVAAVDGTAILVVGTVVNGGVPALAGVGMWLGGDAAGLFIVTTAGLIAGHWWLRRPRRAVLTESAGSLPELMVMLAFTIGLYAGAFAWRGVPLVFPLLAASVWAGSRFSPLVSVGHTVATGTATVVLTLHGTGPFARVTDGALGGLFTQLFVVMLLVTGLALSVGRAERHELERELAGARDQALYQAGVLGTIVDSITEGLVVVQQDGTPTMYNPAAWGVLGFTDAPQDLGRLMARLQVTRTDGSELPESERPTQRALRGEVVLNQEVLMRGRDGGDRVLSISAAPLPTEHATGRRRAVLLLHDITTEHAQKAELARFAGVVAHDLLGPLTSIEGWATVVREEIAEEAGFTPEMADEFVGRIQRSSIRMRQLIRDLLAHATSGDKALHLDRVAVGDVVAEITATRQAAEVVHDSPIPDVQADPVLVRQLMDNLIGNALKYVAPGSTPDVRVTGERVGGQVKVAIADRGIGLAPDEYDRVFEEFYRAHREGYAGTGLGLAICRRIVERHGGRIGVRPNPEGQGTLFEFTLPAA